MSGACLRRIACCLLSRLGFHVIHTHQGEEEPAQCGATGADQDERVETDEVVESPPNVLGKLAPAVVDRHQQGEERAFGLPRSLSIKNT